ncbi:unnamed protein product, partial [Heligmosomoides polygyrus]|uniref:G_PROTEIN_RECEP_F1_2 domain-containing protein n=1 Tax=Heligmosomoides polygyrus TaxID=6339 RepID=A0A183G2A4_HELPZ
PSKVLSGNNSVQCFAFVKQFTLNFTAVVKRSGSNMSHLYVTRMAQSMEADKLKIVSIISVYYCLPAVVLERCFATYFLDDYERKPRTYIGYFIIMSLLVIATWSSYMYHTGSSVPILVIFICRSSR